MKTLFLTAAAVAGLCAVPAQAALYTFTISGDYTASFQIDSSPTPNESIGSTGFVVWDRPVTHSGGTSIADIGVFDGSFGGGLSIIDYDDFDPYFVADGPQLYTGTVRAPTFLTGTFQLTEYQGTGRYTLTIAQAATAVPEPAGWAMMIAGIGIVGGAMRRRSTKVSYA